MIVATITSAAGIGRHSFAASVLRGGHFMSAGLWHGIAILAADNNRVTG